VPLGYALVDHVARAAGVRCLAIKGPVLHSYGLRGAKRSRDVDVLIDPANRPALLTRLGNLGWSEQAKLDAPRVLESHSVTIAHPDWPITVDVHERFPGFLDSPTAVFEALWGRRTEVSVASRPIVTTSRTGNLAIAALHYLRDERVRVRDLEELATVARGVLTPQERLDLVALAAETASEDSLRPIGQRLGVTLGAADHRQVASAQAWRTRQALSGSQSVGWLLHLTRQPLRTWPRVLWKAMYASDAYIRAWDNRATTPWLIRRARLRRALSGIAALPRAVWLFLRQRPKA
jgi:hypothetical protein